MERLPENRVFENVTITPNGKTAAVLEGHWDDIYVTLINIRNDGRLVPYAHHPVDLENGRMQLQVELTPAAPTITRAIPVKPERSTKRRVPRPSRAAMQVTGIGLAAVAGAAAVAGLVWALVVVVPVVVAFVAAWFWLVLIGVVLAIGAGVAMESQHHKTATHEEEPSIYPPGYSPPVRQVAEPGESHTRHWLWGSPQKPGRTIKPVDESVTASAQQSCSTDKPFRCNTSIEEAAAEAKDIAREQRRGRGDLKPNSVKYHWFTGKIVGPQGSVTEAEQRRGKAEESARHHWISGKPREDEEAMAEARAEARDIEREQRYWWGGLKPEYLKTDELTTRILTRMRDRDTGQTVGGWQGGHYDLIASSQYDGDATTALTMHGNDKCGVQWMMHEVDPKDDRAGKKHGAWDYINDRYGKKTVKNIIQMNDGGTRLPKIADYLEEQERRRAER